ncbi:hypothetical protein CR105_18755 [Massilia eurypsychrophila]|uniref:DUF2970 domain-containing protein n=1 Tax=Massilia eurypsychrophila TaxID=1485217 RepID=A0A2G8TBW4_9BURK|nr:DUF2970 domain-containing protein [Massilia eurypsychrophila]PIL43546.1 hypothetical protein CR105_18755 [Massilia eurypsychrophila]
MGQQDRTIKTASFFGTIKAVLCAFAGIRKSGDLKFHPVYIVAAGLLGVAVFVSLLILIVRSVV